MLTVHDQSPGWTKEMEGWISWPGRVLVAEVHCYFKNSEQTSLNASVSFLSSDTSKINRV